MDGDDISGPNRLQKQVDYMAENKDTALLGTWAKVIDKNGKEISEFKYPAKYKKIRKKILLFNPFVHSSVVFKKKIFDKLGGYDEGLKYSQDYDLFLRMVINYRCANLPKYLHKFRWEPDFEKQGLQHRIALKIRWKAVRKYGYSQAEVLKLTPSFFNYLIPKEVKKYYWKLRFIPGAS